MTSAALIAAAEALQASVDDDENKSGGCISRRTLAASALLAVQLRRHHDRLARAHREMNQSETTVPGRQPAAQDEGAAGESPDQEASACAAGDAQASVPAQEAAFVTPAGGADAPPAADGNQEDER